MTLALRIIGIVTLASFAMVLCCGCFLVAVMAIKSAIGVLREDEHFPKGGGR